MRDVATALAGPDPDAIAWRGKGATLAWLAPRLRAARVPPSTFVDASEWRVDRAHCLLRVARAFDAPHLAVRSDRSDEDCIGASAAGRYHSCLDVCRDDPAALASAIDAVFASYGAARPHDRALVQPQIAPVLAAVVASTHGLPDGAPYYTLAISQGPQSDAVTRGGDAVDTWYVARDRAATAELPLLVRTALDALLELERLVAMAACEAEIVVAANGRAWVVQLRQLSVPSVDTPCIVALRRDTDARVAAHADVPLLGLMPDWNPAELLGEHPRPLAGDIFARVIARRAWRMGRVALGYSRGGTTRLLHVHAGRPYVDVAASFGSLLPATLDPALGARLVAAWLIRLEANPALHDKIEFEVAMTSITLDFDAAFDARHGDAFSTAEREALRDALRRVTRSALDSERTSRLAAMFSAPSPEPPDAAPRALRRCLRAIEREIGIAFATAARQAFVAEALLRSAVAVGALSAERLVEVKRGVDTIAAEFQRASVGSSREILIRRFGRLRAGTFDIAAPAFRAVADELGDAIAPRAAHVAPIALDRVESACLSRALLDHGFAMSTEALLEQYASAVRVRELGKFALADRVSGVLDSIAAFAETRGLARESAGWLTLDALLTEEADAGMLVEAVAAARRRHALESQLRMPLLVRGSAGALDVVRFPPGRPNYLGRGRANGRPVRVDAMTRPDAVPLHALLAIASADPGFEWMLLRRPVAIVTAFGGPNSHIAIRSAELGVPALLGVGPEAFRRIVEASELCIDFDTATWSIA
jgi:phosphohistidine swiveling domain-containing protein